MQYSLVNGNQMFRIKCALHMNRIFYSHSNANVWRVLNIYKKILAICETKVVWYFLLVLLLCMAYTVRNGCEKCSTWNDNDDGNRIEAVFIELMANVNKNKIVMVMEWLIIIQIPYEIRSFVRHHTALVQTSHTHTHTNTQNDYIFIEITKFQ